MNLTPKNIALLAHIPIVGPIIAYVKYQEEKSPLVGFYMRQTLGILLLWVVGNFVQDQLFGTAIIGGIFKLAVLVAWIISLLGAIDGKEKLVPYIGTFFQDLFKSL